VSSTTRTAILVRHAHADWPMYSGRDFDRPLTPRGEEDAAATAHAIHSAGLSPTLLLASPARRTRQTAMILADVLNVPEKHLLFIDAMYNAKPDVLLAQLQRSAPAGAATLLVAHNPGISELARQLAADPSRPPFAPAGWACFALSH
jgi:phosphohistidine phosphatase